MGAQSEMTGTLLTGEDYKSSLDDGRRVLYRGEEIDNVAEHPITRGAVEQVARVYDAQHAPETQDVLTRVRDGQRVTKAWMMPTTIEDLRSRREAIEWISRQSLGTFGRHMDMGATTQVGALAHEHLFRASGEQYAANIRPFIAEAEAGNRMIAGSFADPQGIRSKRRGDEPVDEVDASGFPATLRIVREDSTGFWVSGPKAVATALPYAHECFVTSPPNKAPDETFWFVIPVNSPGLTMLCRDSTTAGRDSWDHPVAGRADEVDALLFFDEVFVPGERVFMRGDSTLGFRQVEIGGLEYWYTLIRMCVKAELLAALAHMVVDVLETDKIPLVRQQLAEVDQYAVTLRAFIVAAEERAAMTKSGALWPDSQMVMTGRLWSIQLYSRVLSILRELGGQGSMMRFSEADYGDAELGARMKWFLEGRGMPATDKALLFNLLWDLTSDGYSGRTELFEMLNGFPVFHLKDFLVRSYDPSPAADEIRAFLGIASGS